MDLDLNTHMECRTREMTMKISQTWSKSGFPYTSSRIGSRFPPSWDTDQRAEVIRRLRSPPRDDIDRQHSMVALDMTTMSDFGDILTLEITFQSDIMNPVNVSSSRPHFLDVADLQPPWTSRKWLGSMSAGICRRTRAILYWHIALCRYMYSRCDG